ncbi:MAG: urate hydroxylase PuuD [Zoogloeaceae bacterium]|nr:urate hydroxylase PuuD [Zoogloeaceae bacterium]
MDSYLLDWANLLLRWLHLIAGVAWIGSSFYFVMLDNALKPPRNPVDGQRGVIGELWAVHGGGFYCSQKFPTGPRGEPLPEDLHWSKWQAYTTWLSGMGLLVVIYWVGASTFLVDPRIRPLGAEVAVVVSASFLAGGWVVYEALCRLLDRREGWLAGALFVFVVAAVAMIHQFFAPRAAYLHVGAMLGTLMAANVFVHIIPGQNQMVAQLRAGQAVDPRPGQIGKQRSVHNTYFTLPVLFIMISQHYPMTYARPQGWLVLVAIMVAGVLIRQYFVLRHRGSSRLSLLVAGAGLVGALIFALAPATTPVAAVPVDEAKLRAIILARCLPCHATQPTQPGFAQPPRGVVLETPDELRQHARRIGETVASGYMPLANLTGITEGERQQILAWAAKEARP